MQSLIEIGRLFVFIIILAVFLGVIVTYSVKLPVIGKLPGDLYIRKGPLRFYLPLGSSILLSLLLNWVLKQLK